MFKAIETIRKELVVAQAQLETVKNAKGSTNLLSNTDMFEILQRVEYQRGRVDMATRLITLLVKDMRQEAANEAWTRSNKIKV